MYILASKRYGTLYVGATNDLLRRIDEHRRKLVPGFTKKYHTHMLVYYELGDDVPSVFEREKQLKGTNRSKKIWLIESMNPYWIDLYPGLLLNP